VCWWRTAPKSRILIQHGEAGSAGKTSTAIRRLAREIRPSSPWVPKLTPDGRLYGRACEGLESVLTFWNNQDGWPDSSGASIAGNEVANKLGLFSADRHKACGYTVAWGTGELFVLYEHKRTTAAAPPPDEATSQGEVWVMTGPFGQSDALMRPRGPVKGLELPWQEGFSTDCDHWGRRLYLMECVFHFGPLDDSSVSLLHGSQVSRVTVVDAGTLEVVNTWRAPYAEGMVYTDSGHVVLAHNATQDPRVGVYTPGGDLISWWPLNAHPMDTTGPPACGPCRLRRDPRTGRLVVLMVVSATIFHEETPTLVYE
jgi:hypothetical protein